MLILHSRRENGMRADLAQTLADLKPSFFRFPGGNNLECVTCSLKCLFSEYESTEAETFPNFGIGLLLLDRKFHFTTTTK